MKMEGPRNHWCCPFLASIHHDPLWSTPLLGYFGVPDFDPGSTDTRWTCINFGITQTLSLEPEFLFLYLCGSLWKECLQPVFCGPSAQPVLHSPSSSWAFQSSTGAREWGREFKKVNICSFSSSLPSFWSATIKPSKSSEICLASKRSSAPLHSEASKLLRIDRSESFIQIAGVENWHHVININMEQASCFSWACWQSSVTQLSWSPECSSRYHGLSCLCFALHNLLSWPQAAAGAQLPWQPWPSWCRTGGWSRSVKVGLHCIADRAA